MDVKIFLKKIIALYGDYNPEQLRVVAIWLEKYKGDLNILYAETLRSVSWKYKMPPSPKEFENCKKAIFKAGLEASRPELQPPPILQIDEDMVTGTKASDMLIDALGPLARKMNINRRE